MSFKGNLFGRLIWMVAAAAVPALLVIAFFLYDMQVKRTDELGEELLRQAAIVQSDFNTISDSAKEAISDIVASDATWSGGASCRDGLRGFANAMPRFGVIAVLGGDGTPPCLYSAAPFGAEPDLPAMIAASQPTEQSFHVGRYLRGSNGAPDMLLLSETVRKHAMVRHIILGVRLDWLAEHLATVPRMPNSQMLIADTGGTILARAPNSFRHIGDPLVPDTMRLLPESTARMLIIHDASDEPLFMGFKPVGDSGVLVLASLPKAVLQNDIATNVRQGVEVMLIGIAVAILGSFVVGQRLIRRPARAMVEAARAWSRGDFSARLPGDDDDRSEFGRIARAFNRMASDLQRKTDESAALQSQLEARVAERTRDLLLSRDRLQIALGEQAKSEASLRQAQKIQMVGQLAGGVAHDFNNLLTALIGALDMLRPRLPDSDLRSLRLVDNALQSAERGARLTSQLLAFSRRQRLQPVPTCINDIFSGMMDLLRTTIGRDIEIATDFSPVLRRAMVDPNQFEAAILNLVLNARDALPKGGTVTIRTRNLDLVVPELLSGSVGELPAGSYVSICVEDNGTGIAPELMSRVFEPFFTTKPSGHGSGLGLSQVHGLAAQSGGTVRIESELGRGTIVCMVLPAASAAVDMLPMGGENARKVIAVVDDEAEIRALVGDMLIELGHDPVMLAGAAEALARLPGLPKLDAVIVDQVMPGMSGIELIARLRQLCPQTAFILATGHAERKSLAQGVADTDLAKPFSVASLSLALEEAMQCRGSSRSGLIERPA
ncbi:MAG: ATP-binding protein [Acetobacteraceae bacterium]|nr:ATP-binding protein [Acetobacteraceae bacterium]